MIVTCERCQTRFELEDAKLPPAGARVRCSRCRFSFFVKPAPGADGETQVVAPGGLAPRPKAGKKANAAPAEDATRALGAPAAGAAPAGRAEGGDDESDWQFNEEPARKPSATRRAPVSPLREFLAPAREEPPSLEQLGDPESWDLVGGDEAGEVTVARVRPEAPVAPRAAPMPERVQQRVPERAPEPVAEPALEPVLEIAPAPVPAMAAPAVATPPHTAPARLPLAPPPAVFEEPEAPAAAPGERPLARGLQAAGWAATLGLAVALARASLAPAAPAARLLAAPIRSGPFAVRELSVRRLENAWGQRLLVVSGRLANEGEQALAPATGLRLSLLADDGEPLGHAGAAAAVAPGEERLREQASEDLLADNGWRASVLAWTPIAAHEASEFAAVVFDPPAAASRFRLELTSPPPQPPPATPAPPPLAPEPTAPSLPSSLPSSG